MRILIGAGEEREGVYYFTGVSAARVHKASKDVGSSGVLWHHRLGHPSVSVLLYLPECDRTSSFFEEIKSCDIFSVLNKQEKHLMIALIKFQIVFHSFMLMFGVLIALLLHVEQCIFLLLSMITRELFGLIL